ncbi:MAG: ECF-type sigma factor [Planctomycetota bacterium]
MTDHERHERQEPHEPQPPATEPPEPRDPAEFDRMFVSFEKELRDLAEVLFHKRANHTLQRTALVNEAYMRLKKGQNAIVYNDRDHLFQIAANTLERVLIDHQRGRKRLKRGGGQRAGGLGESDPADDGHLPALSDDERTTFAGLLDRLGESDARMADVVRMRILQGMSMKQIAAALGCSERSVFNDWKFAKAKLQRALEDSGFGASDAEG